MTERQAYRRRRRPRRDSRHDWLLWPGLAFLVLTLGAGFVLAGRGQPADRVAVATVSGTSLAATVTAPAAASAAAAQIATAPPVAPAKQSLVIAWQPSHQADTGAGYTEYVVCGDIVDRTIALLPEYRHVKAWDLKHGLTGSNNYRPKPSNTPAFDNEVKLANDGGADVFVSVHNDGGAPSGILGEQLPGDKKGAALSRHLTTALAQSLGLHDRGVRDVRLYSLEAVRNNAPYRCLIEVGDNKADRALLTSESGRQKIAEALAAAIRSYRFSN